ncbi:hypothetical protein SK128_028188, partial [Halocaridina rubra]
MLKATRSSKEGWVEKGFANTRSCWKDGPHEEGATGFAKTQKMLIKQDLRIVKVQMDSTKTQRIQ